MKHITALLLLLHVFPVSAETNAPPVFPEGDRWSGPSVYRCTPDNSFLVMPTNRPHYHSPDVYISNALQCATAHYPKLMARPKGDIVVAPDATIRMSELTNPAAPVHVVLDRPAKAGSLYPFDNVHVVLHRDGRVMSHETWPRPIPNEDEDPEQNVRARRRTRRFSSGGSDATQR